jgi:hypothetical protein
MGKGVCSKYGIEPYGKSFIDRYPINLVPKFGCMIEHKTCKNVKYSKINLNE